MNFIEVMENLPIGFFVLFGLYIVAVILELFFAYKEMETYRRIVKPFLMLLLGVACWIAIPYPNFIVPAIFCGLIGDVLVILPNKKCFPLGVLFFFFGHALYISEICVNTLHGNISISQLIVIIAVFVVIYVSSYMVVFRKIADSRIIALGMSLYYSSLVTVLPTVCIATASFGYCMFLCIIGSVFFITSDTLLMYCKYGRKFKRHHFYIMGTYLVAQALIVVGFVLSYTAVTL